MASNVAGGHADSMYFLVRACLASNTGGNCRGIWKVSATVVVTVALDMALTDQ